MNDWRDRNLWPAFTSGEVQGIAVDWVDPKGVVQHYKVERVGDTAFKITEPIEVAANRSDAMKLFEKAPQFTADDFGLELDPNLEKSIRDLHASPLITIRIFLKNGTTHTLKGGGSLQGYQFTQHPYHRNIVWVFKWRYDYFKKTVDELMVPN